MLDAWTAAKYLGAFGGGVVVAGFFLSGPVERPGEAQTRIPPPAIQSSAAMPQAGSPAASWQAATPRAPATTAPEIQPRTEGVIEPRSVRTVPLRKPSEAEQVTVGSGDREPAERQEQDNRASARDASAQGERCDVSACSRKYRSFDEASCTYQPYNGGPRRLCER
jgi:hypothetical protein